MGLLHNVAPGPSCSHLATRIHELIQWEFRWYLCLLSFKGYCPLLGLYMQGWAIEDHEQQRWPPGISEKVKLLKGLQELADYTFLRLEAGGNLF